jgi:transposase
MDSSGSHHRGQLTWPRGLHALFLPRYSPELNQASQVFRHMRKTLSNRIFTTLDELQNALIDALQQ